MVELPAAGVADIPEPAALPQLDARVGRQDFHQHPPRLAHEADRVLHQQAVILAHRHHPGRRFGIHLLGAGEVLRQLVEQSDHAGELIGDDRADFGQPPPGAFPYQVFVIAVVHLASHFLQPAAVAGQVAGDLRLVHLALLPQEGRQVVEGGHGVGKAGVPAVHPQAADPADAVRHPPVDRAEIRGAQARKLLGDGIHGGGHLSHGFGGIVQLHHHGAAQALHRRDVPAPDEEAVDFPIHRFGQGHEQHAAAQHLINAGHHQQVGGGDHKDDDIGHEKGPGGGELAEPGEDARHQAAEG